MHLFLLEDDYLLNKAITQYFSSKGYTVSSFLNGVDALNAIADHFSVLILDIDVPNLNGISILEEARRSYPSKPIIMISATIDIDMIDKAYQRGCNDYMKKPFNIRELELKIATLTQSYTQSVSLGHSLEYNPISQQLFCNAQEIILTPQETKLVHILIQNKGRTVNMETIATTIWGMDGEALHLRQLVSRVRKKLPENIIKNRQGSGYCVP